MKTILLVLIVAVCVSAQISVKVPYGTITGTNNQYVERFLGIPYTQKATPRFTRGVPIVDGEENQIAVNATALGPICPQLKIVTDRVVDETLCLNLNVVRPRGVSPNQKLPVMVYIYGGAFIIGHVGETNPDNFVAYSASINQSVIHVAMNYRLNAFGFLASKEMKAGNLLNLGIQDQNLALRWVKRYISFFGGDPNKVTLYGQSAGAISTAYHLHNPNNKGLIRGAIMQSGSSTSLAVLPVSASQDLFFTVAKAAGCPYNMSIDTLDCLKEVKQDILIQAARTGYFLWGARASPAFGPVLSDLIPVPPSQLMKTGKFLNVPVISGEVRDEGTLFVNQYDFANDSFFEGFFRTQTPRLSDGNYATLLKLYPNDPKIGSPYFTGDRIYFSNEFKRAASLLGDVVFGATRRYSINTYARRSNVWTYRFEYVSNPSLIDTKTYEGVSHSSDIPFVWLYLDNPVSKAMATYWITFANTLNPNPKQTSLAPQWDQYSSKSLAQISFGNDGVKMVKDDYRREQMTFIINNLANLLR